MKADAQKPTSNKDTAKAVVRERVAQDNSNTKGMLKIVVRSGDLTVDESGLFDDLEPYVILELDSGEKKESKAKKGMHPFWDEAITLDIKGTEKKLTLRVSDKDVGFDDDIGQVVLPIAEVRDWKGVVDHELKIFDKEEYKGLISIQSHYVASRKLDTPSKKKTIEPNPLSKIGSEKKKVEINTDKNIELGETAKANLPPKENILKTGVLRLTVSKADLTRDLSSFLDKMDP